MQDAMVIAAGARPKEEETVAELAAIDAETCAGTKNVRPLPGVCSRLQLATT